MNRLHPRDLKKRRASLDSHVSRRDQETARRRNVVDEGDAYHLPSGHADGLDVEFSTAHVEQILEAGP